ncbi:transketolase [Secundilactobacillus yichangensis]|uniref:transketolase n=1 Tax=Secundilactobacillus yichangensis TaxID=2799580 RepID=UPI0022A69289|nr:transketolase [Secundilactobacillus yichangensis]
MQNSNLDQKSINALRFLSVDMIEKANSGHPGLPLGAAPMAYTLWTKHLNINPTDQHWINRDRFILSAGHGSSLLYSLLHLSGFNLTIDDLKQFRQLNSKTPGHPEYGVTDGVEATTGPLGQGLGMAVGMAMAESHLAAQYNKPGFKIMDHYTYALAGDGDLMEGISHESASLAGHLKLGKLIVLYDDNSVSLDGPTDMAFTDDTPKRFEAYNWQVLHVADGNNPAEINAAIEAAKQNTHQPTLIDVKTVIGFGAPNAGTNGVHGKPLGEENMTATRKKLGWDYVSFDIPDDVRQNFEATVKQRGIAAEEQWQTLFDHYLDQYPELASQLLQSFKPVSLDPKLPVSHVGESESGRNTSQRIITAISEQLPSFWGGSADLFSSNKTNVKTAEAYEPDDQLGKNVWFGVREFAEAAAVNGMTLHGGIHAYASTFFVFSDYMRAAIRLAAIQKIPSTFVFTHDSIAVGEDGPTHEPIEQLMSFRAMPNVNVIRPADINEAIAAWQVALAATETPTMLVLTRQNLPTLPQTDVLANQGVKRGGYVLSPAKGTTPEGILIATGSEVQLALSAQEQLRDAGRDVSVVSLPSFELFDAQPAEYREQVLPSHVTRRVAIEMGTSYGWEHYVGLQGKTVGINNRFGESGNPAAIMNQFGFTADNVAATYLKAFSEKTAKA